MPTRVKISRYIIFGVYVRTGRNRDFLEMMMQTSTFASWLGHYFSFLDMTCLYKREIQRDSQFKLNKIKQTEHFIGWMGEDGTALQQCTSQICLEVVTTDCLERAGRRVRDAQSVRRQSDGPVDSEIRQWVNKDGGWAALMKAQSHTVTQIWNPYKQFIIQSFAISTIITVCLNTWKDKTNDKTQHIPDEATNLTTHTQTKNPCSVLDP